jgi:ribosome-binding factor A
MSEEKDSNKARLTQQLRELSGALRRSLGNKIYMRSIDTLLEKIDSAEPHELEAIRFLINDLSSLRNDFDREKKKMF